MHACVCVFSFSLSVLWPGDRARERRFAISVKRLGRVAVMGGRGYGFLCGTIVVGVMREMFSSFFVQGLLVSSCCGLVGWV